MLSNVELALTISGISGAERRRRATKALEQVGSGRPAAQAPQRNVRRPDAACGHCPRTGHNPDILLADEPTGALDSDTSIQVMELLKDVAKDRLVVMVTHNPELAERYATRIVRLRDGVIQRTPHRLRRMIPLRCRRCTKKSGPFFHVAAHRSRA